MGGGTHAHSLSLCGASFLTQTAFCSRCRRQVRITRFGPTSLRVKSVFASTRRSFFPHAEPAELWEGEGKQIFINLKQIWTASLIARSDAKRRGTCVRQATSRRDDILLTVGRDLRRGATYGCSGHANSGRQSHGVTTDIRQAV